MNKIIKSVAIIAFVAAIAVGATSSYFSDEEKSTGNTFTAGTIDISVDGQNPWQKSWHNLLDKPSQTNYMTFTIQNVGENPANVWKKLTVTGERGGESTYCGIASSEPEYTEGGGVITYDGNKLPVCNNANYVERADLSSYMVYDMSICELGKPLTNDQVSATCELEGEVGNQHPVVGTGWEVVIDENHEVRVDNVNGIWIKLNGELQPGKKLLVSQSYHLKAWNDAVEPEITNWAQGDVMTFDITLDARQVTAPAPNGTAMETLQLREKDPVTWNVVTNGAQGTLTFKTAADVFDYSFSATGLLASTQYDLIYYADPFPGNNPGGLIGNFTTNSSGDIVSISGTTELFHDLPVSSDANYPVGAKIQLVLNNDYDTVNKKLTAWNPSEYLFEMNLISYNDTNN